MTQQINLYQPELFEKRVPFSAIQMAWSLAAILFLVAAAGVLCHLRLSGLSSELGRLEERQNAAIRQIDDYKDRYPPPSPDPDLVREVEEMADVRQAKLTLLQLLTGSRLGNSLGLSEHLAGLARQDLSTVWLRRIHLGTGGERLLLEGSTTRAADIPLYLQGLTAQKVFSGREFEHFQLNRPDEKAETIIDFLLQTTQGEAS
ncbi:hypothetical protein [uncultured Desulfosarcina sp.]|uniref:hypothetical protein n=1 Tax=uncultured Desulfosarcina sp. TaxID=218289 RepID=UPI0029C7E5A2|nr:hypothetical protein [uncultured Desulfosarcina sp.]